MVFMAGHPNYVVNARYDPGNRREMISVAQTQHTDTLTPIFDMPIEFAFYGLHGQSKRVLVRDHWRIPTFDIPVGFDPRWVDFDPDDVIDKTLEFAQPLTAWIAKARNDPAMMSCLSAVQQLGTIRGPGSNATVTALTRVLGHDAFYGVRWFAAARLGDIHTAHAKAALLAASR